MRKLFFGENYEKNLTVFTIEKSIDPTEFIAIRLDSSFNFKFDALENRICKQPGLKNQFSSINDVA